LKFSILKIKKNKCQSGTLRKFGNNFK